MIAPQSDETPRGRLPRRAAARRPTLIFEPFTLIEPPPASTLPSNRPCTVSYWNMYFMYSVGS